MLFSKIHTFFQEKAITSNTLTDIPEVVTADCLMLDDTNPTQAEILLCINALQTDINSGLVSKLVPAADNWVEQWVGAWTTYTTKLQNKRSAHIVIPVLMDKVICDLGEIVLPTIGKYSRHPLANAFLVAESF